MAHRPSGEDHTVNSHDEGSISPETIKGSFQFTFEFERKSNQGSYIEPEASPDEADSSESLSESVQTYPEEYGRTYHAYRAGSYVFPNDEQERERLKLQYYAITRVLGGKLFLSPLTDAYPPRRILDIATGTGEWAIEIGDHFRQSQVTATDLSPIQPAEVPPNVTFFVEDSSEEWQYTTPFDFIHTRITAGSWSNFRDQIATQAFEALNPGGYFESQEYDGVFGCDDGTLPADSALARWSNDLCAAAEKVDRPIVMAGSVKAAYEDVGFVDVQEKVFKIPTNGWPKDARLKEVGKMWENNFTMGLSGFSWYLFNKVYGRSPAEIEVSLVDVRRDLQNPRIHAYTALHVVWGRKPFPGENVPRRGS